MTVRPKALAASLMTLLLATGVGPGCLDGGDDGPPDLSGWEAGMSIEKYETNGVRAVNTTYLHFEVSWGALHFDDWLVSESHGFKKGDVDHFALSVTASYMNGSVLEPFPIQGSSATMTGAMEVRSKDLRVVVDGEPSTYVIGREYDIQPHDYEATARIKGDYGELVIYFLLLEPRK